MFVFDVRGGGRRAAVLGGSLLIGLGAALGFAWFMSFLIESSEMRLSDAAANHMLDFVRMKRSETVERKDRKPERPQVNEVPDTPTVDQNSSAGDQLAVSISAPTQLDTGLGLDGGMGLATGDGDYLPIVKVAPLYPRWALMRGIEGTCLVRYTVTPAGTVKDVEVLEDQCDDQSFHKPSVDAAKRFKYKPRVVDGEAIEVRGVLNRFHFEQTTAEESQ
jgi:protein TonB